MRGIGLVKLLDVDVAATDGPAHLGAGAAHSSRAATAVHNGAGAVDRPEGLNGCPSVTHITTDEVSNRIVWWRPGLHWVGCNLRRPLFTALL